VCVSVRLDSVSGFFGVRARTFIPGSFFFFSPFPFFSPPLFLSFFLFFVKAIRHCWICQLRSSETFLGLRYIESITKICLILFYHLSSPLAARRSSSHTLEPPFFLHLSSRSFLFALVLFRSPSSLVDPASPSSCPRSSCFLRFPLAATW